MRSAAEEVALAGSYTRRVTESSLDRPSDVVDFETELERLRAAVPTARIREELLALERERRRLEHRIAVLRTKLDVWLRLDTATAGDNSRRFPSKRDAVLALLREGREARPLADIREELVARGWMSDDPASRHALEVAVAAMAKRRELVRLRRGVYAAGPVADALGGFA